MAQLRLALAQVNPTVGDLAGNAAMIRRWTAQAAERGAHLVAFPEMVLTGYPVEDLALRRVVRRRLPGGARRSSPADLAADGLGDLPSSSATSTRRRRRHALGSDPTRVRRRTPPRVLHGGRVVARYAKHHLPNYGVFDEYRYFVPGDDADRRPGAAASTSRSPSARTSGRTAARSPSPARPAPGCCWSSTARRTSGTRTTSGSTLVRRRAARGRLRRSPTSTWSAARTSWSSTATRWSSAPTARCSPAARSSSRSCSSSTSTCRRDAPTTRPARREGVRARRRVRPSRVAPYAPRTGADRAPRLDPVEPRSGAALVLGLRDYVRKNGFRSVAARPVRRHRLARSWRPSPPTRSAARTSSASRMPERVLLASTPRTTPPSWPSAPAWTTGSCRSQPMVDAVPRRRSG